MRYGTNTGYWLLIGLLGWLGWGCFGCHLPFSFPFAYTGPQVSFLFLMELSILVLWHRRDVLYYLIE
jgi:hypothetical protein